MPGLFQYGLTFTMIVGAIILAYFEKDGWGWALFVALLTWPV